MFPLTAFILVANLALFVFCVLKQGCDGMFYTLILLPSMNAAFMLSGMGYVLFQKFNRKKEMDLGRNLSIAFSVPLMAFLGHIGVRVLTKW